MPNRRRHSPDLPVLPFNRLRLDPRRRHRFAKSNRRIARRRFPVGINHTRLTRFGFPPWTTGRAPVPAKLPPMERVPLAPSKCADAAAWDRADAYSSPVHRSTTASLPNPHPNVQADTHLRKPKFRQRPIGRSIRRELREDSERFVKRNQHRATLTTAAETFQPLKRYSQIILPSTHAKE